MWGYSNTETLGGCEMESAFSAFLLSSINTETQALLKPGVREDRGGFSAALEADGLLEYDLWLEIISHRCWKVHNAPSHVASAKWSFFVTQLNKCMNCPFSGFRSCCFWKWSSGGAMGWWQELLVLLVLLYACMILYSHVCYWLSLSLELFGRFCWILRTEFFSLSTSEKQSECS